MDRVDCIVVGAGVVGLACAAALARTGREVFVLEKEGTIGMHSSSRNSEVIHAGLYYQPGSLKARLCREGRDRLYAYARERNITHRKTGKLIVASSPSQMDDLAEIERNALANEVTDLQWHTREQVRELEPEVRVHGALYSPSTGIIDSHALMLALEADIGNAGGMVVLGTHVTAVTPQAPGFIVETSDAGTRVHTDVLVNCAGLGAIELARRVAGIAMEAVPNPHYAIGHYYRLSGPSPCSRLVYPVPEPGGLGIHLTLDLGGQARFGPDVRWIDIPDYRFDDSRRERFAAAIGTYLPDLDVARLQPDYTGIRPKIAGPQEDNADFRISGPEDHGMAGLVNLFGIESPGLTASLAIAEQIARTLSIQ
ncbi:NAD(P)/FAD-dependent oxidoreductase [Qipengyuania sp. G39]|uniref:NAD(P)/FAD-dependent oxidoreductase n=1 Tax=Qipengyuania profundimaris TaxID=3067652 RepID=A0ABT9HQC1_9SPHN|nr:NAD(P)/FAD-dependent oxidoreductase [Qipengyuania sp. G39]MDP4574923.1 NAD(P)/FAD-dependent oxidoreductase [Qipengyuania sp. G39]